MSFSLVNNLGSLSSQSRLAATSTKLNQTIQHLSSGLRINSSGDDAAGLSVANSFRSDVTVLNQGVRNANDGLSTLQIVDGGLNNVSNLLDRASTLAAQSASDTFSGNRDTLQSEFTQVLGEITRQAQNIGLVAGGKNNTSLTTVIGGGSDTFAAANSNNGVVTDLSGAANRVDAAGLGLASLNIGTTTGTVAASGGLDFGAAGAAIGADENLTFQFVGATGTLTSYTASLTNGQSANSVVEQLNNDSTLKAAGITAGVDSSGNLELKSASFFTATSDVAAGATSTGVGTAVGTTSAANTVALTATAATAASTQDITFTYQEGGATKSVQLTGVATSTVAATAATNLATAINGSNTLRDAGIFANTNGAVVDIASTKVSDFSVNRENAAAAANNSFGTATTVATDGTGTGGAAGGKDALDAIKTALGTLGQVQGTVGAGQNRLLQAVDLATSQINNFQSAESRIRDADIASEASNMSRLNVLQQAGVAALSQANQSSQAVISLLR
jgi:flagellin